jgi:hypothetical protein
MPDSHTTRIPLRRRPVTQRRNIMGKYFLAWLLGVPFFVLVLIYLFFH